MKFNPTFLIDSREQQPYRFEGEAVEVVALPEGEYRSEVTPASVLASLAAWQGRYSIPFQFCGDREGAAIWTRGVLYQYARTVAKGFWNMRPAEGLPALRAKPTMGAAR